MYKREKGIKSKKDKKMEYQIDYIKLGVYINSKYYYFITIYNHIKRYH